MQGIKGITAIKAFSRPTISICLQVRSFASQHQAPSELHDDTAKLQEQARQFAQKELKPLAAQLEHDNLPVPHAWLEKFSSLGFLGVNIPTHLGGLGQTNLDAVVVLEEFAKISSAVAFPVFESSIGPIKIVQRYGLPELQQQLIPKVCAGQLVVGIAMSEPDAGTALTDLKTRARVDGKSIVINGQKRWMSGGGHSDMIVFVRLSDEPGAKGVAAVYVPRSTPGITFGKPETLMGFRGVPSADIFFENARVPVENLMNAKFSQLMEVFDLERLGNATMAFSQAQAALDDVVSYLQERKQFGKHLIDFQAVQLKLADMKMKVDASRLLLHRAARNADSSPNGLPSVLDSSIAKCYANEIAVEVCSTAMQLMGGYGYSTAFPMERRMRDALGWRIAGGTVDIQKVNIAASLTSRRFDQRK